MIAPDVTSASPHFNAAAPSAQGVVIHATRSGKSMNPTEFIGTLNHFKNPYPTQPKSRASAQWLIGRDGRKARIISDHQQAWHAGQHNATHFGIELEQGVEADGFTEQQLLSLILVCRGYVEDFGIAPSRGFIGFIAHSETPQGLAIGKSDPGRFFPWDWFITALQEDDMPTLEEIALAFASYVHFVRNGFALADLSEQDKAAIKAAAAAIS